MSTTLYKTLGVSTHASQDEIKRAYRRLAQRHHPDRETGAAARFQEIQEAYDVLADTGKRAEYDRTLPRPKPAALREPHAAPRRVAVQLDVGGLLEGVVEGVGGILGRSRKRGS